MDPMDYTMANPHMSPSRPPNTAPRCPYQQAQVQAAANNVALDVQPRDGQHYDPVHDANTWAFQNNQNQNQSQNHHHNHNHNHDLNLHISGNNNNANVPSRSAFTPPQNLPQWDHGSYAPIHTWHSFGGVQQGMPSQAPDPSIYNQRSGPIGFPMAPWDEIRAFESLPFGYSSYIEQPPANNHPLPDHPGGVNTARVSSAPAPGLLPPTFNTGEPRLNTSSNNVLPRHFPRQPRLTASSNNTPPYYLQRHARPNSSNHLPDPTQRQAVDTATEGSIQNPPMPPMSLEQRVHRTSRYSTARMSNWLDTSPLSRRRVTSALNSDDDDDADVDIDGRHGESELYFNLERDEQRALATMHRAIAASKKVPSREAIAALEKVNVEDLQATDRTCIICYNEFGVSNPEGVVESPLRLPKCKHVFGDKCIKKWFEENDSCPYCRDKLPSELSARKTVALESLRQQQHRLAAVEAHRIRSFHQGFPTHMFGDEVGRNPHNGLHQRTQDEYSYTVGAISDGWGQSPMHRNSPSDPPENRRRQARGRIGGNRATHLGRPTSVGSARFVNPVMNHQNASQRAQVLSIASSNQGSHDRLA